jgi:hypothetical protein
VPQDLLFFNFHLSKLGSQYIAELLSEDEFHILDAFGKAMSIDEILLTWKGDNMNATPIFNGKTSQIFVMISLLAPFVVACTSQPAPVTESASPTQAPTSLLVASTSPPAPVTESASPTQALPSPTLTIEPTMSAPETPMPVTAFELLIGKWLSLCGAGPCTLEFKSNGKYRNAYVNKTETGITSIESGTVTFTEGVLHFVATSGGCEVENHPNGYYTAALFHIDNELYLVLTPAPNDECPDRQHMYTRDMKFLED